MIERVKLQPIRVEGSIPTKEEIEAPVKRGHPKKYRGNHRSQVRGAGMRAFRRNRWMKRYI